jgi:uncharacterized protein (TIGR03437 family)
MKRTFTNLALALLVCAAAPAATISTTLTVDKATGGIDIQHGSISASGAATLTNIGSGTILATAPLAPDATGNISGTFTITLTGGADKIAGTFTLPASVISGTSFTGGSLAVTSGSGTYAGATGSFTSLSGSGALNPDLSFSLSFTGAGTINTGGTVGPPVPTITSVLNGASNTPGIAQGAIFIVKGTNLSASGFTSFDVPRPTQSSGVKITFTPTGGGAATDAFLVYLFNQGGVNQLAAILPSTVAPGSYNVTVTNGGVSSQFTAQVVASKVGLFTQDSSGSGLGSVQNFISQGVVDLNRLTTGSVSGTTISPAHPGQFLLAYGTGLGPLAAGDNSISGASFDFSTHGVNVQAIVGGVSIPVAYAGRAGFPGEDQINFALPANIPTGCAVPFQLSVNGVLSPATTIAIAPDASSSACVQPGFTSQQLQKFDNGGTYTIGSFSVTQFSATVPSFGTVKSNSIGGAFSQLTGFQLGAAVQLNPATVTQSGSCQVIQLTSSGTATAAGGRATLLDAGTVTVNGPAGSSLTNQALKQDTSNSYGYANTEGISVPGQPVFSIVPGTYSLSGAGGKDVGTFNTSISLGSPLTVTGGLPSTVTRSAGMTLNWTGGNASDLVEIIGSSSSTTGTGSSAVTNLSEFVCITTAGQTTFTVPASILNQLPATTTGSLSVASGTNSTTFTAPLKAGGSIDAGVFGSFLGLGATPTYQ